MLFFLRLCANQAEAESLMRIGITGASGFVGGYLIPRLRDGGHECIAFSRSPGRQVKGCSETRAIGEGAPRPDLSALDAVVNLAGESIMGRWTERKKERIRQSRIQLTEAIADAFAQSEARVLLSASATGYYGDRGDEILPETAPRGEGFLADVAVDWENAALRAERHGARVALPRFGFIVAPEGGAMDMVRPIFRYGLGGRLGPGTQWMPWVHIDDVVGIILHLLEDESLHGAFNAVAPNPVTNAEFTHTLARVLRRPAILPAPSFALRLALGEMSSLVLDSTRAVPERTLSAGYRFRFEDLASALR